MGQQMSPNRSRPFGGRTQGSQSSYGGRSYPPRPQRTQPPGPSQSQARSGTGPTAPPRQQNATGSDRRAPISSDRGAGPDAAPERAAAKGYQDLIVWQKALDLAVAVHQITKKLPADERQGLALDVRRAATAVAANVAAGQGLPPVRFADRLLLARASLAEVDTLLHAAGRLGYLSARDVEPLNPLLVAVRQLLHKLLQRVEARAAAD